LAIVQLGWRLVVVTLLAFPSLDAQEVPVGVWRISGHEIIDRDLTFHGNIEVLETGHLEIRGALLTLMMAHPAGPKVTVFAGGHLTFNGTASQAAGILASNFSRSPGEVPSWRLVADAGASVTGWHCNLHGLFYDNLAAQTNVGGEQLAGATVRGTLDLRSCTVNGTVSAFGPALRVHNSQIAGTLLVNAVPTVDVNNVTFSSRQHTGLGLTGPISAIQVTAVRASESDTCIRVSDVVVIARELELHGCGIALDISMGAQVTVENSRIVDSWLKGDSGAITVAYANAVLQNVSFAGSRSYDVRLVESSAWARNSELGAIILGKGRLVVSGLVEVTVVDSGGKPLSGIVVSASPRSKPEWPNDKLPDGAVLSTKTNTDGIALLWIPVAERQADELWLRYGVDWKVHAAGIDQFTDGHAGKQALTFRLEPASASPFPPPSTEPRGSPGAILGLVMLLLVAAVSRARPRGPG
jgi:hypothetical protein